MAQLIEAMDDKVVFTVDISQAEQMVENLQLDSLERKGLRKVLLSEWKKVKKEVQSALTFKNGDPRHARDAVKAYVWKPKHGVLGATVTILNSKSKAEKHVAVDSRVRKVVRPISERTKQIDSYWGRDRAFVLRILDVGRNPDGRPSPLAGRHFFKSPSLSAARQAAENAAPKIEAFILKCAESRNQQQMGIQ